MEENEVDEQGVEQTYQDMIQGLEIGMKELQPKLCSQVDNLTQKQLRRLIKAMINYPQRAPILEREPEGLSPNEVREVRFLAGMITLHEQGVQLELNAIGQLLKEQQQEKKENEDG